MKSALHLLSIGILGLSLFTHALSACINTSYSRADEIEITDDLLPLILGAFPHHGWAFYEHEIVRTLQILNETPKDFDARNDLGAAYTKHNLWTIAQSEFEKNEKLHSSRYETASNLGVMFNKKGDYGQAEKYIAISPLFSYPCYLTTGSIFRLPYSVRLCDPWFKFALPIPYS